MITLIYRKPVRSHIENGEVVFNMHDVCDALDDLRRVGLPKPVDPTATMTAEEFCAVVMDFLAEELVAIDVWMRDAIDGNNARHLYPPDTIIGRNIDYWERVCVGLTGRTPNQILAEARARGIEVESWQVALEHLDYPLACAVYFYVDLMNDGMSFEEATQKALASIPDFRADCRQMESVNFSTN